MLQAKTERNCRKISIQHLSARQGRTDRSICHWTKTYCKNCSFGDLEDELIRDKIVCGVNSDDAKQQLLRVQDLTLDKNLSQSAEHMSNPRSTFSTYQRKWT